MGFKEFEYVVYETMITDVEMDEMEYEELKKHILESVVEFMGEKKFEEITVDIVERKEKL